jgi:hypothetical protein
MNCCLPWGQGVCLCSPEEMTCTYDQTDLNLWFRLILRGGGRTFQKLGPFDARGADRPHHQAAHSGVGPPRGPLRPGGSLILLDASFLGAKSR